MVVGGITDAAALEKKDRVKGIGRPAYIRCPVCVSVVISIGPLHLGSGEEMGVSEKSKWKEYKMHVASTMIFQKTEICKAVF